MTLDDPICTSCGRELYRPRRNDAGVWGYWCEPCDVWVPSPNDQAATAAPSTAVASRRSSGRAPDPVLANRLLMAIASHGGIATTHDVRPEAYSYEPDLTHQAISFALIRMRDDDGLLLSPFGHADTGDDSARRTWLRTHRPGQPTEGNQVWALAPTTRRELLEGAREADAPASDPALAGRFTTALLHNYDVTVPEACGYRASRILQLLAEESGPPVVRRLIERYWNEPSDGFIAIVGAGHPELTFESFVTDEAWAALFTALERYWCARRLQTGGAQ